jgi:hypothetical protein
VKWGFKVDYCSQELIDAQCLTRSGGDHVGVNLPGSQAQVDGLANVELARVKDNVAIFVANNGKTARQYGFRIEMTKCVSNSIDT